MKQKYHLAMDDASGGFSLEVLMICAAGSSQRAYIPTLLTKCC